MNFNFTVKNSTDHEETRLDIWMSRIDADHKLEDLLDKVKEAYNTAFK